MITWNVRTELWIMNIYKSSVAFTGNCFSLLCLRENWVLRSPEELHGRQDQKVSDHKGCVRCQTGRTDIFRVCNWYKWGAPREIRRT